MMWLVALLLLPPVPAARIAARAVGVDERALVRITMRETQGRRIGVHDRDRWASRRVCSKAKAVGQISPRSDCAISGWSTRGAFGLMAAYNLKWLGVDRWPWVLDVPAVSAIAAARRYRALCPKDGWCP